MKKNGILLLIALLVAGVAHAESGNPLEEFFFASGKIRVVIAVVSVVMTGFLIYVILIDRKVTRLEEKMNSKKKN